VTDKRIEHWYAKLGPTIYARCKRLLKDNAAAEDATQEIFLKVMRHINAAPSGDSVIPWIHRITTNHCLNVIRDSRRHAEPTETLPEVADDAFEDSVVTRDFADRLMAQTPEVERAPAVLYHQKGMEQGMIAKVLGVSRRTVLYRLAAFAERAQKLAALTET
jgi:RNA polymerase sigma-70 factor, ECF subfamily